MGVKYGRGIIVVVMATCMLGIATANKDAGNWNRTGAGDCTHKNATQRSNRIVVGGSENWHFGFNYTDWAIKNGPFFLNDTLGMYVVNYTCMLFN